MQRLSMRWLPLALVPFLLASAQAAATPPADAFCVITIQPLESFESVRVIVDLETNLTQREALWPRIDLDRDGRITPEEMDTYRKGTLRLWAKGNNMGVKTVHLDAKQPLYAATWEEVGHTFHLRDYKLPSTLVEAADLETQEVREFRFNPAPAGRVTVSGGGPGQTESFVAIEYVVVRAPPGWIVTAVEGHTYDGPMSETFSHAVVDLPAFDTKKPYNITFERQSDKAPAPVAAWSILLFAAAAVAARRRGDGEA